MSQVDDENEHHFSCPKATEATGFSLQGSAKWIRFQRMNSSLKKSLARGFVCRCRSSSAVRLEELQVPMSGGTRLY